MLLVFQAKFVGVTFTMQLKLIFNSLKNEVELQNFLLLCELLQQMITFLFHFSSIDKEEITKCQL